MSDESGHGEQPQKRPVPEGYTSWSAYWTAQEMPWRTEPAVDEQRQQFLSERRAVKPDIQRGIYPFKDIRLTRAEVEWLLATHENGRGPVNWNDPTQWLRRGLDLRGANLCGVNLRRLPLAGLRGGFTYPESEALSATPDQLEMGVAHLEGADLTGAHLEGADLREAHLEATYLAKTHLEGKHLSTDELVPVRKFIQDFPEILRPANLQGAFFSAATSLTQTMLGNKEHGYVRIADVRWGSVNLWRVEWTQSTGSRLSRRRKAIILGDEQLARQPENDEQLARQPKDLDGIPNTKPPRGWEFAVAVRANRQLAVALRNQGMNEDADRFAYRAQVLQQEVLRRQRKFGGYLFSRLLDGVAGYGYKPIRGLIAYVLVILGFAFAYGLATHGVLTFGLAPSSIKPLQWYEALVLSISSFHGRGFFQPVQSLGDPVAIIAAGEAIIGLLIEISFIATFTQRFFGR